MATSSASLKAKLRQAQAQQRRAITIHNHRIGDCNRAVRRHNEEIRRLRRRLG